MLNKLTASLICMDLSDIKTDIDTLLDNGINHLHADFMDNTFVPRIGISPELIQWIKKRYGNNVVIDSHLMVKDPISCLDVIAPYSDWTFFHFEAVTDPTRVLQVLSKYDNTMRGVAYNISTDYNRNLKNTGLVDAVLLMGISPGVLGTKSWPEILLDKISDVKSCYHVCGDLPIFIDGGVGFKTIKKLLTPRIVGEWEKVPGADFAVCGSSTLFKIDKETELMTRPDMIKYNIRRIEEAIQ